MRDRDRVRTSVDRFIQKALEEEGLALGPDADRATLVRRLSFDLTGLPPRPEEIVAFAVDRDPGAYEKLVDRLLASPAMANAGANTGWTHRDTLNPTDISVPIPTVLWPIATAIMSFVRAMPIGRSTWLSVNNSQATRWRASVRVPDAAPPVIDQLVATHYLRNGQDGTGESDGNPDEVRADKYAVLEGAIQIIGSSLLGLTLQCAKCHDHKFEPVTQKEYYQLQAILYPAFNLEHWKKPDERVVIAGSRPELGNMAGS